RSALAAEEARAAPEQFGEDRRHRYAAGERVVVPAVGAERVVVRAHRGGEPGRDGLLSDAEVGRAPDEPLEEELLRPDLEVAAFDHRPVHPEAGLEVGCLGGRRHTKAPNTRWRRTARRTGSG